MPSLQLFIDVSNRQLVRGFNSSIPAAIPNLFQGDTVSLNLRFMQATGNSAAPYTDIDYSAAAVELAIGTISAYPTAGAFTLTDPDASQTTGSIAYNAPAATVQAAIQAGLATNWSTATVTGVPGGPYTVTNGANAARSALQGFSGSLTPLSSVVVGNVQAGSSSLPAIQFLKLVQNPIAFTSTFAPTPAAAAVVTEVQLGSGTQNEIQSITLTNSPYAGTFSVNFGGQTSGSINYNDPPSTVQAVLQAMSSIGSGNVTVSGAAGAWIVTFTGTLGLAAQSLMTTVSSLIAPLSLTGTIALNTGSLEELLGEAISINQTLEIQVTPSGGSSFTAAQGVVSIANDLIENAVSVPAGGPSYCTIAQVTALLAGLFGVGSTTFSMAGTDTPSIPSLCKLFTYQEAGGAGTAAYIRNTALSSSNRVPGDKVCLVLSLPASTNPTIKVKNNAGTVIWTEASTGVAFVVSRYFTFGTDWTSDQ